MDKKDHWEDVYQRKKVDEVSWYQTKPECSLRLIASAKLNFKACIIDVGGGASKLVDCLLDQGYLNLSVLDISGKALSTTKERLGPRSHGIKWIETDILNFHPEDKFDFWHDRAVFHFLTDPKEKTKYLEIMGNSLNANAYVLIASFGLEGPEKCSGLSVQRYDPALLQQTLGSNYTLLSSEKEIHLTPSGSRQQFVYCLFRKMVASAPEV
ncbi:MAG: putative methylase protein [uncultured bacterium]|nr:MAG: putative methylase protein [uncultured bacterium]